MSNRGKLRRKVVLPVSIVRRNGEEKQLAHTLDVTEFSARLGGLGVLLEPGEVIEVQRGAVRAKFQVHWMGAPGDVLAGQAGIRGIDTNKSIWGVQLPADKPDIAVDRSHLRDGKASARRSTPGLQFDPNVRYECGGPASVRAPGSNYPVRAHLKNIHLGGLYLETITTFPLKTILAIEFKVEGIPIEVSGEVSASTPRVGMDITFHKVSPEPKRKIVQVLQKLKQKEWDAQQPPAFPQTFPLSGPAAQSNELKAIAASARPDPCRLLVTVCQTLTSDFDGFLSSRSPEEIEELKKAVAALQKRLGSTSHAGPMELASLLTGNRHI